MYFNWFLKIPQISFWKFSNMKKIVLESWTVQGITHSSYPCLSQAGYFPVKYLASSLCPCKWNFSCHDGDIDDDDAKD